MDIKIEKNVPMPLRAKKYPFAEMEVGDSFVTDVSAKRLSNSAAFFGIKNNMKFSVRTLPDGSVRCWRVE